jgi:hypothetical protein
MGLEVVEDFREEGAFIDAVQQLEGVRLRMVKLRAPDGSMIELLQDDAHPAGPAPAGQGLIHRSDEEAWSQGPGR